MAKMGKFSASDMKKLQKQLNSIQKSDIDSLIESCAKELAAKLIAEVTKRTPVGEYGGGEYECKVKKGARPIHYSRKAKGKTGGTLRRGWTAGEIRKEGGIYKIDVINPVEYASYVEYGHRKPRSKGWVPGHFMLTISEQEIQNIAPKVLENKIRKFLGKCMK